MSIYLEAVYDTNFTGKNLTSADSWRGVQKTILCKDLNYVEHLLCDHQELEMGSAEELNTNLLTSCSYSRKKVMSSEPPS